MCLIVIAENSFGSPLVAYISTHSQKHRRLYTPWCVSVSELDSKSQLPIVESEERSLTFHDYCALILVGMLLISAIFKQLPTNSSQGSYTPNEDQIGSALNVMFCWL